MLSMRGAVLSYLAFVIPAIASQRFDARQAGNEPTPVVTIASGPLRGNTAQLPDSETTVNQFLGIPFARPPIDDLRFAPPQAPPSWDEPYDATSQPPACMQYMGREGPGREMRETLFNDPPPPGENEDCLYLNVYAPSGGADNKAVLFWIYGGSGTAGAASQPIYDGTTFAANHDIVVVAANYRVNGA
jgi:carboxylesterase type B